MKILAICPNKRAVYTYRIIRPLKTLGATFRKTLLRKNERIQIKKLGERLKKIGDIWVMKYATDYHTTDIIVTMAKETGAKLVMDIDDNIWQTPVGNAMRHAEHWDKYVALNTMLVQEVDYVTVATEPLKQTLLALNENITVLPNLIDPKDWKYKRKKHDKIRIGWIWSVTHIPDMSVVKDALEQIHKKYGDKIEIVMLGAVQDMFKFPTTNIQGIGHDSYPKLLTELSFDISICPLADNEFNKCKSNIKWLESTLSGAAVVASKVYPYEYSIEHGTTGYLASNTNQWVKHLSNLIENEALRENLVKNAKAVVVDKYDINKDTKWKTFYESL